MVETKKYLKNINKHQLFIFTIISFIFIFGVIVTFKQGHDMYLGNFQEYNNDDVKYIRSAQTFIETGTLTYQNPNEPTVFIMPLFPMVLSFFIKLFGFWKGITVLRLFQLLLLSLTLVLVYKTCKKIINQRVGLIVITLSSLYLPHYVATNLILTEILGQFLLWLFLYVGITAVHERNIRYFIYSALFLSLSIYVRPNFALLPLVFLFYMFVKGYKWKEVLRIGIMVGLIMTLCLSPWWIRNLVQFKSFIPLTESSGNPMLLGTKLNWSYPPNVEEVLKDDFYYTYSVPNDRIETNRREVILAKKIRNYGFKTDFPRYAKLYTIDRITEMFKRSYYWKPIFNFPERFLTIYHYILLLIGFFGFILSFITKGNRKDMTVLFFTISYFVLTSLPFITFERYGYFLMLFITIYVAFFLDKFKLKHN